MWGNLSRRIWFELGYLTEILRLLPDNSADDTARPMGSCFAELESEIDSEVPRVHKRTNYNIFEETKEI